MPFVVLGNFVLSFGLLCKILESPRQSPTKFDNGRNLSTSPLQRANEHTSNGKRTCHRSAAHLIKKS